MRFGSTGALLKTEAAVEVTPEGATLPDLPLLVLYGYYLLVMQFRDSAAGSAGAVVATSSD